MTTIRDVARHAEVSPATVSLVLRNADTVHPRTRRRVQEVIGKLGYQRRPAGRPASQSRRCNIAIAYPGAASPPHIHGKTTATRQWFDAIRHSLTRHNHHMSFFGGLEEQHADPLFQQVVRQGEIDCAVFIGGSATPDHINWTIEQQIPVIAVNRHPQRNEFSSVGIDNFGGGRIAAEHLLQLGHRRLGMVGHIGHRHNRERYDGFIAALAEQGLEPLLSRDIRWGLEDVHPDNPQCRQLCQDLLQAGVTGVFIDGDHLVAPCVDIWSRMGVRVPQQLSVIGFDHTGERSQSGLQVTSVGSDSKTLGEHVAEFVTHLVRKPGKTLNLTATVRTFLAVHDTTAKAPDSQTIHIQQGTSHD